jgi:ABC-type bacteriocin/lantibiotic exporter with double-glycine peptidase domain
LKKLFADTWKVLEKKERRQFLVLAMFDLVISVADILSLALLLWIVKYYVQPEAGYRFMPQWAAANGSVALIAFFFVLFGIKNAAGFFVTKSQFSFIGDIAVRISRINLSSFQEGSYEDFVNIDSSVQIRKIALQPFEFCQYIVSGFQQAITQALLIALTVLAILLYNATLFFLILLVLLPPVVGVFYFLKKRLTRTKTLIRSGNERSYQYLLDALKGYVEGNVYGKNEFFMERFIGQRKSFSRALFSSLALQNLPGRLIEVFAVLGLFILITLSAWFGERSAGSLITIGAFMAAAYKIIPGIVKLINITGQMRAYEYAVSDLVKPSPEMSAPPDLSVGIHSLEMKNISFSYAGQDVLKDFQLHAEKGDFVAITGQSGKGKTTILNLLLGFLSAREGEILINGQGVTQQQLTSYWPAIAYVRQQNFFIHDSAVRNIALEEFHPHDHFLQQALSISGTDRLFKLLPGGQDMVITENGKNISGGQQQRIALARAIYKNAGLLLLDEPFNELDEESCTEIIKGFRELADAGCIVIMITHDRQSLSHCNKIISLDG